MFPSTSGLYTQISQKRPAIEKRESGWIKLLFENLRLIRKILDTLYEYVLNAKDPSGKNLEALLDELNKIRMILREDVVTLNRKLSANELQQMPPNWKEFVVMVQNDIEINNFLGLQESLRLYMQLIQAKSQVLSKKNIASLKKDLKELESQRKEFLQIFWHFREKFSRYVDAMPS